VSRLTRLVLALAVAMLPAGPALAGPERAAGVERLVGGAVLLLPPRIDVYELAPGGTALLKAEWTRSAREHVQAALDRVLGGGRLTIARYQAPSDPDRQELHAQVLKVHRLVQAAIVTHRYTRTAGLPTKPRLEWSLGPGVAVLREQSAAPGYGLFVELAEFRVSRHFVNIGGVADELTGAASIVDLVSGDVLWFNHERGGGMGSAADAMSAVQRLLRDLPG
jgi:hypothetical protein